MKFRTVLALSIVLATVGFGYPSDNEGLPLQWTVDKRGQFNTYTLNDKEFFFKVWCKDNEKALFHLVKNGKSQDVQTVTYIEDYYGISTRTFPKDLKKLLQQEKIEISTDTQIHTLSVEPTNIPFNCQ